MGDLHEQKTTDHQNEKHDGKTEEGSNPSLAESQSGKPYPNKDSDIMIAADLNLYASPMTVLQNCKKSGQLKKEGGDKYGRSGSGDHMIAADLRKYGNPLDEK